jgi:SAM-dependent methyltransferase
MPEDSYASIAGLYDFSYDDFTEDLDFYENLAQITDGPVLELGVGTGRVAVPLAQSGYEVVGLDASPSMLAVANERIDRTKLGKGSVELVQADMTRFDLGRHFGLIFVAANTFQHLLKTEEQKACVACVVRHLAPAGIFALSVRAPSSVTWEEADGWAPLLLHWTRTDPATGDIVMKFCAEQPEPALMTRRLTYVYDRIHEGAVNRSVFATELRYSTQGEIELLLQQAGLHVTHVYGDYDLTPVGLGDNLVFVARAEGSL